MCLLLAQPDGSKTDKDQGFRPIRPGSSSAQPAAEAVFVD